MTSLSNFKTAHMKEVWRLSTEFLQISIEKECEIELKPLLEIVIKKLGCLLAK